MKSINRKTQVEDEEDDEEEAVTHFHLSGQIQYT